MLYVNLFVMSCTLFWYEFRFAGPTLFIYKDKPREMYRDVEIIATGARNTYTTQYSARYYIQRFNEKYRI